MHDETLRARYFDILDSLGLWLNEHHPTLRTDTSACDDASPVYDAYVALIDLMHYRFPTLTPYTFDFTDTTRANLDKAALAQSIEAFLDEMAEESVRQPPFVSEKISRRFPSAPAPGGGGRGVPPGVRVPGIAGRARKVMARLMPEYFVYRRKAQ